MSDEPLTHPRIHSSAQIHQDAKLADDVSVGAFSIIGANVEIGAGTWIGPHVVINGHTRLGKENKIFQFCSIGEEPQHLAYKGEPTRVEIGDRNTIREFCTIHRGTTIDNSLTAIGNDNLLMAYGHIAHDCVMGNHNILANGVSLAGHVIIADKCLFGGFALVHQFCRVGHMAFLGYSTGVSKDVPPFVRCADHTSIPYGINTVGMKRAGYKLQDVATAKSCYKLLYRSNLRLVEAQEQLAEKAKDEPIAKEFAEFLEGSKRGIIR